MNFLVRFKRAISRKNTFSHSYLIKAILSSTKYKNDRGAQPEEKAVWYLSLRALSISALPLGLLLPVSPSHIQKFRHTLINFKDAIGQDSAGIIATG